MSLFADDISPRPVLAVPKGRQGRLAKAFVAGIGSSSVGGAKQDKFAEVFYSVERASTLSGPERPTDVVLTGKVVPLGAGRKFEDAIMNSSTVNENDLAVIEPRKGRRESPLPATGLLVFTSQDLDLVISGFRSTPRLSHRLYQAKVYLGSHEDTEIAVAGPSLGAPQTILILEKLIALGVKNILAFGWCGSLQSNIAIGDVILPNGALSEEGTSQHYPVNTTKVGPAPEIQAALRDFLKNTSLTVHEGSVWTTDAPFREMMSKVVEFQREGILGVEMEVSALFTVAHFRGVRLAAVLAVSDELYSLKWVHGFSNDEFNGTRQVLAKMIVQIGCSIGKV